MGRHLEASYSFLLEFTYYMHTVDTSPSTGVILTKHPKKSVNVSFDEMDPTLAEMILSGTEKP